MSALAEALVAAQRRALSQLEKAYVAGAFEDDRMREMLDAMGLADAVDQDYLVQALDVIRTYGGPLPSASRENGARSNPETEKATDAQLALIARLVKEKGIPENHTPGLPITKAQAHEIIDSLKAGTYDAEKWAVPF